MMRPLVFRESGLGSRVGGGMVETLKCRLGPFFRSASNRTVRLTQGLRLWPILRLLARRMQSHITSSRVQGILQMPHTSFESPKIRDVRVSAETAVRVCMLLDLDTRPTAGISGALLGAESCTHCRGAYVIIFSPHLS